MLTTYHHPVPLSRNLGTLTSWNPLGPSGSVTGLIFTLALRTILKKAFGLNMLCHDCTIFYVIKI